MKAHKFQKIYNKETLHHSQKERMETESGTIQCNGTFGHDGNIASSLMRSLSF